MKNWTRDLFRELAVLGHHLAARLRPSAEHPRHDRRLIAFGAGSAVLLLIVGLGVLIAVKPEWTLPLPGASRTPDPAGPDYSTPVRPEPDRFPANTHKPNIREGKASLSIHLHAFIPDHDLIRIDDDRVWWESEHDHGDTEDDHIIHRSMEAPLRRLIELVDQAGGTLKVQDTYRASGIHAPRSLHKQGRAVDVTCDELGLEKLAKLCWAAGFDWVYHEVPRGGGSHVHASVRPDGVDPDMAEAGP